MRKVIGQTGGTVLSDDAIKYKKSKKRTVRYWYVKMRVGYRAEVIGPFHSTLYGTCGFGALKTSAKAALERNLANNHGYLGRLLFSDVDTADTVGDIDTRLLDDRAVAVPITRNDAVGVLIR